MKTFISELIGSFIISYALVLFVFGLSFIRVADRPERNVEVPKEVTCEKPKFNS